VLKRNRGSHIGMPRDVYRLVRLLLSGTPDERYLVLAGRWKADRRPRSLPSGASQGEPRGEEMAEAGQDMLPRRLVWPGSSTMGETQDT